MYNVLSRFNNRFVSIRPAQPRDAAVLWRRRRQHPAVGLIVTDEQTDVDLAL